MDFGAALQELKRGNKVARSGWNGKGLWVELQTPDEHSKMTLPYLYLNYPTDAQNTPGARVPWMAWKDGSDRDLFGPATNYTAGQCFHTPDIDACEANARRIVACVNACAGVTTEELEQGGFVTGLIERLEEKERQRDALQEELENIATAEWREFDPDTRRCAYEFVLWAQSRARHTLNRVLSGDVTAPLPEDVKLVQVGPCACSDHECGECMKPEEDPAHVRLDEMVLREKS